MRYRAIALSAVLLSSCGSWPSSTAQRVIPFEPQRVSVAALPVGKYIKHVVIVIQENRSFENLFAGYPGADAPTYGYSINGKKIPLHQVSFRGPDLYHTWGAAMVDWNNGKMDGFSKPEPYKPSQGTYPYSYVKHSLIAPYWSIAQQYVLSDRMFPTMFGVSFTAHLDLIAGNADLNPAASEVNWPSARPWGCDAPNGTWTQWVDTTRHVHDDGPAPCFTQFRTIADTLDAAGVSWKYYAPQVAYVGGSLWSSFDAIDAVRHGPDWQNVVHPPAKVLIDAAHGNLPGVSWVVPDLADSDHPGEWSNGPSWVASIVNAIGRGPNWKDTAIVILWDDWGGWYDDAKPPQLDFRGLGIRVPCLIVSAYARKGFVLHTTYEFGSVLHFIEDTFGLPPLGSLADGYTDSRAKSLGDAFDFTQRPRIFQRIASPLDASHFLHERPSKQPPDDD